MTFETRPLTETFGVEVLGCDLDRLNQRDFYEVRALFEEHSALLFRDQSLSDKGHIALAEKFGPIENRDASDLKVDENFEIPVVSNIREDGSVTGEMDLHTLNLKANMLWHADSTFLPIPALVNILVARIVTQTGGATELASTRAGWAEVPEDLKARIRDRGAWHRLSHSRARISPELAALPMFHKWQDQLWRAVWTNPVNGKEALYIASHAFKIEGLPEEEGAELIDTLIEQVTQPKFVYSHAWRENDVLIWDQRAVLHRATPWNYNEPRELSSICVSATSAEGVDAMRLIV